LQQALVSLDTAWGSVGALASGYEAWSSSVQHDTGSDPSAQVVATAASFAFAVAESSGTDTFASRTELAS
jgi:hypothetical protein